MWSWRGTHFPRLIACILMAAACCSSSMTAALAELAARQLQSKEREGGDMCMCAYPNQTPHTIFPCTIFPATVCLAPYVNRSIDLPIDLLTFLLCTMPLP